MTVVSIPCQLLELHLLHNECCIQAPVVRFNAFVQNIFYSHIRKHLKVTSYSDLSILTQSQVISFKKLKAKLLLALLKQSQATHKFAYN